MPVNLADQLQDLECDLTLNNRALPPLLNQLARLVYLRHFSGFSSDRDDLISEAILKALDMIRGGEYRRDSGSVFTFLFSGMRNAMSLYLYHLRKFRQVEALPDGLAADPPGHHWIDEAEAMSLFDRGLELNAHVLSILEGRVMMDLWRNVSDEDKRLFAKLVSSRTTFCGAEMLHEKTGDLVLFMLFLFAGRTVRFPAGSVLEKLMRQAVIYNLRRNGAEDNEVAKQVDLRVAHIQRIAAQITELLNHDIEDKLNHGAKQRRRDDRRYQWPDRISA